jgi:hypothetical protein
MMMMMRTRTMLIIMINLKFSPTLLGESTVIQYCTVLY